METLRIGPGPPASRRAHGWVWWFLVRFVGATAIGLGLGAGLTLYVLVADVLG